MPLPDSAFRHHPELKPLIEDPATSFFRDLDYDFVRTTILEAGLTLDWFRPDEDREALRRATLAGREGQDVWIFAFASLMWNPGIYVTEIREARVEGFARDFCLKDVAGRGSPDAPCLMAGLDRGAGCQGYVQRIAAEAVEEETRQLFRREMISYGYLPTFIRCETAQGPVDAMAFMIDREYEMAACDLDIETQARMIAVAEGILGTASDYLDGIVRHLDLMGVHDARAHTLQQRVQALRAGAG